MKGAYTREDIGSIDVIPSNYFFLHFLVKSAKILCSFFVVRVNKAVYYKCLNCIFFGREPEG